MGGVYAQHGLPMLLGPGEVDEPAPGTAALPCTERGRGRLLRSSVVAQETYGHLHNRKPGSPEPRLLGWALTHDDEYEDWNMNAGFDFRSRLGAGFLTACVGFGALQLEVAAQSARFVPAAFGSSGPLIGLDVAPRDLARDKDAIAIRCQTFVEGDGRLTEYYCVPPNIYEDQKVTRLVIDSLEEQTFVPARRDGSAVRVLMNFTVAIECGGDSCSVEPVPHHGYHAAEFGTGYVAPQPIVPTESWYAGYEDKLEWIHGWMPSISWRFNQNFWPMRPTIAVDVDANGSGVDGCIYAFRLMGDDEEGRNRQKLERAMSSIGATGFIPGFRDDQPVAMRFFEHSVFRNAAQLSSRPPRSHAFVRFQNRYFVRALAGRDEAPDLYCAAADSGGPSSGSRKLEWPRAPAV